VKVAAGFEEEPTEVQLAPTDFMDDLSTARMRGEEAARLVEEARRAPHPPSPSAARRQTLVTRRSTDFSDDSKTDVMTADLRSKMRDLRQPVSPRPVAPAPDPTSTPARSRKR
jgi:hypothetical protein